MSGAPAVGRRPTGTVPGKTAASEMVILTGEEGTVELSNCVQISRDDYDAMAEVQREIDVETERDREELARALALLEVARGMHAKYIRELHAADDDLSLACERIATARGNVERAAEVVLQACEIVQIRRGGLPGAVRCAAFLVEESL